MAKTRRTWADIQAEVTAIAAEPHLRYEQGKCQDSIINQRGNCVYTVSHEGWLTWYRTEARHAFWIGQRGLKLLRSLMVN